MNYLIFDNDVYYDSNGKAGILSKDKLNSFFGQGEEFHAAVIDTLQKLVAAPEKSPLKKDEVIASSFTGDYIIQPEKIAANLFQVIAVEKSRIAEVYKYLGFENVKSLVPYGTALREFLKGSGIAAEDKTIVFLDYMANQVLLTIFNKDIFTAPRRLSTAVRRVVSELTRSEENYRALNKDKDVSFLVATNSREIADEIISSGVDKKENIICFSEPYPALAGLKQGRFSMHYMLPEQFIRLRKLKIFRKRVFSFGIMAGVLGTLLVALLGSFSVNRNAHARLEALQLKAASGNEALKRAYGAKYKDILKRGLGQDISYFINSFIKALPYGYKAESIVIKKASGVSYRFEAVVSQDTKYKNFMKLSLSGVFKQARLENILVKGNPGVKVTLDIL